MKRTIISFLSLVLAAPAFAQDKTCAAFSEDGKTKIAELKYESGKYGDCLEKLKAEVAKQLCKPGLKKVKFKLSKDGAPPRDSFAECAAGASEAKEPPAAPPSEAPASTEKGAAPAATSCADQKAYIEAHADLCDQVGTSKKWSCDKPAEAKGLASLYEKCVERVEKRTGDPGEEACQKAYEYLKSKEATCVSARVILKAATCKDAEGRRKIVNTQGACK